MSGLWTMQARPEEISGVRTAVVQRARQLGVNEPPLEDLRLAVSEAVSNAVMHAYQRQPPGVIDVSLGIDAAHEQVVVRVRDHGGGMSARDDSPGAGMGLALIAAVTDRFEVSCPHGGGTELTMAFLMCDSVATG